MIGDCSDVGTKKSQRLLGDFKPKLMVPLVTLTEIESLGEGVRVFCVCGMGGGNVLKLLKCKMESMHGKLKILC